jgi:hypothetical protein
MAKNDLGHDVFTKRIILEVMITIGLLATLAWLTINTILFQVANIFWVFGLMALVAIISSFVIKGMGKSDLFDIPIAEEPMIPLFKNKKFLYSVFIIMFIVTFFVLSSSKYQIAAPRFQVIDIGVTGDAVLSISAAWMEDLFFFAVVPGLIFSFVYYFTKNFWAGIILLVGISPFIFMVYHLAVYGVTDQAALVFVLFFGFEMTIMMVLLRDIAYVHARHIGNNLGLLIFRQMSLTTFFTALLSSIWFWAIIGLIILAVIYRYRSAR